MRVVLEAVAGRLVRGCRQVGWLQVGCVSHKGVVSFGKEDSGRNLPHGLYVDNIGLNGLLLLADQSERAFFITAAPWVPPSTSTFYLRASVDGITSFPVTIRVLPRESD